jgi:hypothetical protein
MHPDLDAPMALLLDHAGFEALALGCIGLNRHNIVVRYLVLVRHASLSRPSIYPPWCSNFSP